MTLKNLKIKSVQVYFSLYNSFKNDKEYTLKVTNKRRKKKIVDGTINPFESTNDINIPKKDKTQDDHKRRSFDILKVTREECYACDATTQTMKKQKNFCNIC